MGNRIERLARAYEHFCSLPWERTLAGPQRVWFAVYDKHDERRLRTQIQEFEIITKHSGHGWRLIDLTNSFGLWMADQEYRDAYFERPSDLELLIPDFTQEVKDRILTELKREDVDEDTVIAIQGVACLFGISKVSDIIKDVAHSIRGRLLVFFPGEYENSNYRLLDARDGWNYHAIPITAHDRSEA